MAKIFTILFVSMSVICAAFGADDTSASCPTTTFTDLNSCLAKSVNTVMSITVGSDIKADAIKCFENHCNAPLDGNNVFGSGNNSIFGNADANKVAECFIEVADDVTAAIESCVHDNGISNFVAPRPSDFKGINFQESFVKEFLKFQDALSNCPRKQREPVMACLMHLLPSMKSVLSSLMSFCDSTKKCVTSFDAVCDFSDARGHMCSCAKSILKPGSDTLNAYEDSFFQCVNAPLPDRADLIPFVRKVQDFICSGNPCEAASNFERHTSTNGANYQRALANSHAGQQHPVSDQ